MDEQKDITKAPKSLNQLCVNTKLIQGKFEKALTKLDAIRAKADKIIARRQVW